MDDIFIILIDSALIYCWYCCYCSAWWYICNDYSVIIIGCCYAVVDDVFDVDVDVNDTVLFEDSQCQVMSCWWIVLYFGRWIVSICLSIRRWKFWYSILWMLRYCMVNTCQIGTCFFVERVLYSLYKYRYRHLTIIPLNMLYNLYYYYTNYTILYYLLKPTKLQKYIYASYFIFHYLLFL